MQCFFVHNFNPRKLVVTLVCYVALTCAFAGRISAETLPISVYTSADGLGSSFVSNLMRDSRGFLWICTRDGLSRFDGHSFVTYQIGTKESPPGIENIYETPSGVYWIMTTSGLYRFDSNAGQIAPTVNEGDRPVLNAELVARDRGGLFRDRSGTLWYYANDLYTVDENNGKLDFKKVELNLPKKDGVEFGIRDVKQGDDEGIWVLTTWGLVHLTEGERSTSFYRMNSVSRDPVHSMPIDDGGRIWIARRYSVMVLRPEAAADGSDSATIHEVDDKAVLQSFLKPEMPSVPGDVFMFSGLDGFNDDNVKLLYKTSDGHLWISTPSTLIEFDGFGFKVFSASQGITVGNGRMAEDLSGNLWLGTAKGLLRLDRQGMTTYGATDGLTNSTVLTFLSGENGDLYSASSDFYIGRFDGKKFETVRPGLDVNSRAIWASKPVLRDSRNEWWMLTHDKLYRFASPLAAGKAPVATYASRDGLKGDQMFHSFEDSNGDIWIGTRSSRSTEGFGLSKWSHETGQFHTYSAAENFPAGRSVSAIAEQPGGVVWVGFYEGGLMRYSKGRFEEVTADGALLESVITDLHFDRDGRLWFSTSLNGVNRIDDLTESHPRVITYRTENGLASNNARSITEDLFGRIYVGTARGVDRITPESGKIKHFSTKSGLAGDFVQAAFRDRSGALWFGTTNGVSKLEPREDTASKPSLVWISGLRIAADARPVSTLGMPEIAIEDLEPEKNGLQIDFFAIDFDPNDSIRYQYRLEGGADREWSQPTPQRTVNYSNLSPGTYRFAVRAVNADGVASERPATVSFRLMPPIWQRWWFITLAALLVGLGILSLYRYRLANLKAVNAALLELQRSREERLAELERVRSRIARDLHDDVGSSLTQIALYSEVAKQHSAETSLAREPLEFLVSTSNELVDAMSDIVWAINPRKDQLSDLTQRMRHFASEVLTIANIDLEFSAPNLDQHFSLGANLRREIFLIFKESINNIVKHSQATEVKIELMLTKDILTLTMRDNGVGFSNSENGDGSFDWEKARGGNGLVSMKRRAADLSGEYLIESGIGKGTAVILKIPFGGRK